MPRPRDRALRGALATCSGVIASLPTGERRVRLSSDNRGKVGTRGTDAPLPTRRGGAGAPWNQGSGIEGEDESLAKHAPLAAFPGLLT